MTDTSLPTPTPPVQTPLVGTPVPSPVAPPAPAAVPPAQPVVPVASPAVPELSAPVSSKFLDTLRSVSAVPFQDPSAPAPVPPGSLAGMGATPTASVPGSVASVSQTLSSASLPSSPTPTTGLGTVAGLGAAPSTTGGLAGASQVPKESAQFSAGDGGKKPPSAGSGGALAAGAAGGFFAKFPFLQSKKALLAVAVGLFVLVFGGVGAWWMSSSTTSTPKVATTGKTGTTASTAPQKPSVTLQYWGLWEPAEVMEPLIAEYERLHPTVKIEYVQQKSNQYRARLQAALRDGSGPDIFRFHNTWLPMLFNDMSTAPESILPASEISNNYYPIMEQNLARTGKVFGVPLMTEGLALVYNESMLEAANAQPPKDWDELRRLASKLTIRTGDRLERGGIALGTADNVDNFSDILGLMLLQNSADPANPTSENAEHALIFYTLFSRVDRVWDSTMPPSTVAFANEKVAMVIVPSWRIFDIQKANPNLRFGVARLPQLPDRNVTWASYWAEGVNKKSKNAEEAWKFLTYLQQPEQLRRFHSAGTAVRGFGELYPRVDMAKELIDNPLIQPYIEDALNAQSWYLSSMTHDEGLNDQLIQYYKDAINVANQSGDAKRAYQQVLPGIQQILSKYQISAQTAPSGAAGAGQ